MTLVASKIPMPGSIIASIIDHHIPIMANAQLMDQFAIMWGKSKGGGNWDVVIAQTFIPVPAPAKMYAQAKPSEQPALRLAACP